MLTSAAAARPRASAMTPTTDDENDIITDSNPAEVVVEAPTGTASAIAT